MKISFGTKTLSLPDKSLGAQFGKMMNKFDLPLIDRINFKGKDVLEVGCGYGDFTLNHLLDVKSILGIDPNKEAIEKLSSQWSKTHKGNSFDFQVGDIKEIQLQEEAFDIAVFAHSF